MESNKVADHVLRTLTIILVVLVVGLLNGCANSGDRKDARAAATRIHEQIQRRSFAQIYDESADAFKMIEKPQFVADMRDIFDKLRSIKNFKEIAYQTGFDSRAGRTHSLVFEVQCETERVRETLVFVRANDRTMQLWQFGIEPY
jgi:hypothetical protein